jgi:hypothetical protein
MRYWVYYMDKTVESYDRGPGQVCDVLKRNNVAVVVQEDDRVGLEVLLSAGPNGGYWGWINGKWFNLDEAGMWDYMLNHQGEFGLLFGRWNRDEIYDGVIEVVMKDKSAWKKTERRN